MLLPANPLNHPILPLTQPAEHPWRDWQRRGKELLARHIHHVISL